MGANANSLYSCLFRNPFVAVVAQIVGYIPVLFLVDELLQNVFSDEISGIDAVFKTADRPVTFTIVNGQAELVGEGDFHNSKYDKYAQTIELVDRSLYTDDSPIFWFTLVPNDAFYGVYETNNPIVATIVAVCIILATSLFFVLYDFCVRREFHAKRELMEARRQFMRFVSHEVRSPLNSCSMGLELLQAELAKVLGFDSVTSLRGHEAFCEENRIHHDNFIENATPPPLSDGTPRASPQSVTHEHVIEWLRFAQEIEANSLLGTHVSAAPRRWSLYIF